MNAKQVGPVLLACAIVFVFAGAKYGDSARDFFFLDDFWLLTEANDSSLSEAFTRLGTANLYRPLTQQLYFAALYSAFGIDSTGYHLVHLLAFAFTCTLTVWIGWELTGSRLSALACGLLYTSAPGHAAAVYWVSAFTMIGSAGITFASIGWWLRDSGRRRIAVCFVLQVLGLLAGEYAIILPILLLLASTLGPRRENPLLALRQLTPLMGIAAAYGIVRIALHWQVDLSPAYAPQFAPWAWLASVGRYASATAGSLTLLQMTDLQNRLAGAGIVGAIALLTPLVLRGASWPRLPLLGLTILVVGVAPVLPLTAHAYDYYVGIAALGMAVLLVGVADALAKRRGLAAMAVALLSVAVDLATCDRAAQANTTVLEIRGGQAVAGAAAAGLRWTEGLAGPTREITIPRSPVTDSMIDGARAEVLFMANPRRLTVTGGQRRALGAKQPPQPALVAQIGRPFWWSERLNGARDFAIGMHSAYRSLQPCRRLP